MLLQKSALLLLSLAVFLGTGCGTVGKLMRKPKEDKKAEEAAKTEPPKQDAAIGLIEMVNPEQQFVLVRTEMRMTLLPGTKLITQPQTGNKASLIVTPESKQNFISADIVEGYPKRGDVVILPVAGQPQPLTETAAAAASPGAPVSPASMIPGVVPGQENQHRATHPTMAVPQPAVPSMPMMPAPAPARSVPSVPVPDEVQGTPTDAVDPLPPPIN